MRKVVSIRISRSAEADLQRGYRFYESQQRGIGEYFLDSLIADPDSLMICAGVYTLFAGFHCLLSRRFPFAMYYAYDGITAVVVALLDCRQKPAAIFRHLAQANT